MLLNKWTQKHIELPWDHEERILEDAAFNKLFNDLTPSLQSGPAWHCVINPGKTGLREDVRLMKTLLWCIMQNSAFAAGIAHIEIEFPTTLRVRLLDIPGLDADALLRYRISRAMKEADLVVVVSEKNNASVDSEIWPYFAERVLDRWERSVAPTKQNPLPDDPVQCLYLRNQGKVDTTLRTEQQLQDILKVCHSNWTRLFREHFEQEDTEPEDFEAIKRIYSRAKTLADQMPVVTLYLRVMNP